MTSEEIPIVSESGSELSSDQGEWLPIREVAYKENVSERTIQDRIKTGFYPSRLVKGRREVFLKHKKIDPKPSPNGSEANFSTSEASSEEHPKHNRATTEAVPNELLNKVLELADRVLQQSQELTQTKAELEQKKAELVIMNNERASANTALQKASDDRRDNAYLRGEVETLRKETEAAKAENEALRKEMEALKQKKPWWKLG